MDSAIFYKPKETSLSWKELKMLDSFPKSEETLNVKIANLHNIPATDETKSLEEWYRNWSLVRNPNEKVRKIFFFDTETHKLNGFAVSIGCILYDLIDDKIEKSFYKEINPQAIIDPEAAKVHGITDEMVADAPLFAEVFPEIQEMLQVSDMICGYNVEYDLNVLIRESERAGIFPPVYAYLDLMQRVKVEVNAKGSTGRLKNPKLKECADFYGVEKDESSLHNSLYDTEVTLGVFRAAIARYKAAQGF